MIATTCFRRASTATCPSPSTRRPLSGRSKASCRRDCVPIGRPANPDRATMAKILIVDDRPTNRQFLVTLLGYGGHRLLEAANGAGALQRVQPQPPGPVITD